MKNLLSSVLLLLVIMAVGCKSNPVESEAYKTLNNGLQELKNNYTSQVEQFMAMENVATEMKAAISNIENPSEELMNYLNDYVTTYTNGKTAIENQKSVLDAQTEKMANHAKMSMVEITADFDQMTNEFTQMTNEVIGAKNTLSGIQNAYQEYYTKMTTSSN